MQLGLRVMQQILYVPFVIQNALYVKGLRLISAHNALLVIISITKLV